jgi:hypothetical protein
LTVKKIKYTIFLHGFLQNNTLKSDKYDKYYIIFKMCFYIEIEFFLYELHVNKSHTFFTVESCIYTQLIYYILCIIYYVKGYNPDLGGDRFLLNLIKINIITLVDVSSSGIFTDSISKMN